MSNQALKPTSYNLLYKHLELLSKLNDNHLIIFRHWCFNETEYDSLMERFSLERARLRQQYDLGLNKLSNGETYSQYQTRLLDYGLIDKDGIRESIKLKRGELIDCFGIGEFDFWTFDLINLGILAHRTNFSSYNGKDAFSSLYLSPYGKKAVEYIFE
ncbi:hypothetical protein [Changchengzhania lutea]|uniref:hypothetical protein n=1 Tax=Changchengzhania lutea TaxID=2049305 RepID=UPI00115E9E78|nr:hypothetical protein [Changchengzhania lutea]